MTSLRWYHYLNNKEKDCLARHYDINSGLIVRREKKEEYNGQILLTNTYAWFRNHIEFNFKTGSLAKNFHEVIAGRRKPFFDFDKASSLKELYSAVEEVTERVKKILPVNSENKNSFLLFSSSNEVRFSAHLVVNGYFHRNARQAKGFFDLVCSGLSSRTIEILDNGVYSAIQCLRMLGSSKIDEQRYKRFDPFFGPFLPRHSAMYDMELLRASLITSLEECQLLPDYVEERNDLPDEDDLEKSQVKEILAFCRRKLNGQFPFALRSVQGNMIFLERKAPSYCSNCRRVHEAENPYIRLNCIDVHFFCRRGASTFLGSLGEDEDAPLPFEE